MYVGKLRRTVTDKSHKSGGGLTAKGRAKYNRETGSNLKAPQPGGGGRKKLLLCSDVWCQRTHEEEW